MGKFSFGASPDAGCGGGDAAEVKLPDEAVELELPEALAELLVGGAGAEELISSPGAALPFEPFVVPFGRAPLFRGWPSRAALG